MRLASQNQADHESQDESIRRSSLEHGDDPEQLGALRGSHLAGMDHNVQQALRIDKGAAEENTPTFDLYINEDLTNVSYWVLQYGESLGMD